MTTLDLRRELARQFRQQQRFADGYSPLYARIFGIVSGWLSAEPADNLAVWLADTAAGRKPFDVTLLLPAALHRDILAGEDSAGELARFYPTAGAVTEAAGDRSDTALEPALRTAIALRREALAAFIRRANVQTNETGRGLVWLLPVACLGWGAIHLVELGASAGLNLVADRRVYRVANAADPGQTVLSLGDGPPQFTVLARGEATIPPLACCPRILSRTGGDLAPFRLRTAEDELRLAAFIWGDQPERMIRLREGIAALRAVEATDAPVRLHPMRLPDGLPAFLVTSLPRPLVAPVVIFNTTVTMYLPDRGAALRDLITAWAVAQRVPVLWLQWELPPRDAEPPERDWLAWTVDYWPRGGHGVSHHWQIAWVHPHGSALIWTPEWEAFRRITMQN